jgi:hypothetical protein
LHTIYPTWNALEMNMGLLGEKMATRHLCYDMAKRLTYFVHEVSPLA